MCTIEWIENQYFMVTIHRYYDETERDFEMVGNNGPQRGRRSQHHSRSAKSAPGGPPGVHRSSGRSHAETELGGAASSPEYPSTPTVPHSPQPGRQPNEPETGFYNKYASMADDQVAGEPSRGKGEPHQHPHRVRLLF